MHVNKTALFLVFLISIEPNVSCDSEHSALLCFNLPRFCMCAPQCTCTCDRRGSQKIRHHSLTPRGGVVWCAGFCLLCHIWETLGISQIGFRLGCETRLCVGTLSHPSNSTLNLSTPDPEPHGRNWDRGEKRWKISLTPLWDMRLSARQPNP